jgi:uncharacterized damage-inducible protein DinB
MLRAEQIMRRHMLVIAACLVVANSSAGGRAQTPPIDPSSALRQSFDQVAGWIAKSAELVPADKYAYQPAKTVRSFGQLIGHIADGYLYYCGRAAGRNVEWSDAIATGKTDKATIVAQLTNARSSCAAAYAGVYSPLLIENLTHSHLHYGNVITYLRMLGLAPPSTEP